MTSNIRVGIRAYHSGPDSSDPHGCPLEVTNQNFFFISENNGENTKRDLKNGQTSSIVKVVNINVGFNREPPLLLMSELACMFSKEFFVLKPLINCCHARHRCLVFSIQLFSSISRETL